MKGILLRMATVGAVLAAAFATFAVAPASAAVTIQVAPVVSVANPAPGDYIHRGQNWVLGIACDPNASSSDATAGIARVAIYFGDRDTTIGVPWWRPGGYLGSASLSGTTPELSAVGNETSRLGLNTVDNSTCKSKTAGWRVLPSSFKKGTYDMNVYVMGKNGLETKVTIAGLRIDKP